MSSGEFIQTAIDIWGALFCLLALISVFITRHFDRSAAARLSTVLICCILMLTADTALWIFRSDTTETGYTLLSFLNFTVYFLEFIILGAVVNYVAYIVGKRTGLDLYMWKRIEYGIAAAGVMALILNVSHPLIYHLDDLNQYVRGDFYMVPGALLMTGLVLALGIVLEYAGAMQPAERYGMISYLLLPIIAGVIQIFFPDVGLGGLAVTVSSMILFVAYEYNYSQYYINLERRRNEDRMKVISAQIRPHFIFNSLALIRHLSVHEPEETPRAINEFSAFLRACTDLIDEDKPIPATKEFDLVKHYVYMQQQRFGEDLKVEYDLDDNDFQIPAFAVQTTVENAITHGIRAKEVKEGSMITVRSYREGADAADGSGIAADGSGLAAAGSGDHIIEVIDNGVGFDTSLLDNETEVDYSNYDGSGSHSGIQSTRERLRLMCGGTCRIESRIGEGTKVTIRIPEKRE